MIIGEKFRHKKRERIFRKVLRKFHVDDLNHEIKKYHKSFSYLLEPSFCFIQGNPMSYFSTAELLDEAWKYSLDDNKTSCLMQFYEEICRQSKNKEDALNLWMEYLQQQGFCRMHTELDIIEISSAIKKCYDNILGLEDGMMLPIEMHPWMYEDEVISGGMLKR